MNCDCLTTIPDKVRPKIEDPEVKADWKPKNGKLTRIAIQGESLNWMSGEIALQVPAMMAWQLPNGKTKRTTVNIEATFCPFCGVRIKEETPS